MPQVSILLPYHNATATLDRAVESIMHHAKFSAKRISITHTRRHAARPLVNLRKAPISSVVRLPDRNGVKAGLRVGSLGCA